MSQDPSSSLTFAQVQATQSQPARSPELLELTKLDPSLYLDIRYATPNNFLGRPVYTEAKAFLQAPAAAALIRAHHSLASQGLGLLIFDGYRPWDVTHTFWNQTPSEKHLFLANPARGSRHNRGCAVDLTLCELATGAELPMPSEFDEMTERSHIYYSGGSSTERANRALLQEVMTREGFLLFDPEWWHFDHPDWPFYGLLNLTFAELAATQ
ncbi:MAG: M15 family metallopeptidase [Synechococcaceae cyanobacterium SM2_3_1]|nr:M15 family metallopeptidase [Synechococcaceae cyanobacterium SM2_3_1]